MAQGVTIKGKTVSGQLVELKVDDNGQLYIANPGGGGGGGSSVSITDATGVNALDVDATGRITVIVSGVVDVDTGLLQSLTDAQLRATPVPISGTVATDGLTDTELRATPVPVKETRASSPSQSSVLVTNTNTDILASNVNRLGASIYNEGTAICYVKLGDAATTSSYSVAMAAGGYYEVPYGYTGAIDGITASGTAQLRVTELA